MSDIRPVTQRAPLIFKLGALALGVAAVGLPINDLAAYALLLVLTVVVFSGEVRAEGRAWLAASTIVAVAIGGQFLLAPPRIDEGHNVFLPSRALEQGLPADVYLHLTAEFDKQYPQAVRCGPAFPGCWITGGLPDRAYAFSADGVFHKSTLSRSVTSIDFADPVWAGLGFVNDKRYNWYSAAPDVHRADQDRRIWMGLFRWHLAMPWFEVIRLPAAMVGAELCWRGELMWEGAGEHFSLWPGDGCRTIEPADVGRRIFGIAIKPATLAIRLTPPWPVWWLRFASGALILCATAGLIIALVRIRPQRLVLPFFLIGLSIAIIAIADASFLGALRPMEGGDDGLFYDGTGRVILQKFLAGDIFGALQGDEDVFYYGGPALRYFRAIEHVIFGETYLGYLSLVLTMPFLVLALFIRFVPSWAVVLTIIFIAIPLGRLFGTTFIDYARWAFRGFADPAAYILFIAGLVPLLGVKSLESSKRFAPAFFGALLIALGISMKPLIAPAAAVFLGGAGLYALYVRQWQRLAGLCIGFLPVFLMALHNWVYGHVFVLFSGNATHSFVLVMPPSAFVAPAQSYATAPLNAAGVVILIYVVAHGKRFDPWLRLVGGAALAQHAVALFYVATPRYHFLTWFLTMLVVMVFMRDVGIDWLSRRYPVMSQRILSNPLSRRLASVLARLQKVAS